MPTNGDRDHFPSRLRFSALEASRAVHDSRMAHYALQISGNGSLTWSKTAFFSPAETVLSVLFIKTQNKTRERHTPHAAKAGQSGSGYIINSCKFYVWLPEARHGLDSIMLRFSVFRTWLSC